MGLFDDLENKAVNSMLGGSSNPLATGLLQLINNHPGGVAGLVQSFHEKGLGEVASSWVGSGQNLPISADQIQQVLGSSPDVAESSLAQLLPTLIDKLTPNGQAPQHSNLMEMGMSVLQSLEKTGTNG